MAETEHGRRSVFLSFKFLGVSVVGSLAAALVSVFSPLPAQVAFLGSLVSILAGLFLSYMQQEEDREARLGRLMEKLELPVALSKDEDLFAHYGTVSQMLVRLARQSDPLLRRHALLRLSVLTEEVKALSCGRIVFASTESWRTAYEELLQAPRLKAYRSVAWVKSKEYWQGQPGRQAMRLNFELAKKGVAVERVAILRESVWPLDAEHPSPAIVPWLDEQAGEGIRLSVVRERELSQEHDLLCDFGIYGERATGIQDLDDEGRTLRFTLSFDKDSLDLARERWRRLSLYAKPYREVKEASALRKALPPPKGAPNE
jgi:hypothetical protein